ncbi:MAG: hypothetical protein ACKVS7_07140 [Gemmatimonadaceae bacterium]
MRRADTLPLVRIAARARRTALTLLAVVAPLAACGAPRPVVVTAPTPVAAVAPVVPAGVDSAIAVRADSVAAASFVEVPAQERAAAKWDTGRVLLERGDSLWQAFERLHSGDTSVSTDAAAQARTANAAGGRALVALDQALRSREADSTALAVRTARLLDSAQVALEAAFTLNPFDARNRLWLARVYELQARRLGQASAFERAIAELEKLAALTPDEHAVFAMLANDHYQLGQWAAAAKRYADAERIHLATWDLREGGTASPDSALLYSYVRAQGDMHVRTRDAVQARAAFERSLSTARTADDTSYVRGELDWIAWDDGRIASSVARDSLADLVRSGKLADARAGYAELRRMVTTPRAVDEVDWRLAIVEYELGEGAAAATRLHALAKRLRTDSTGSPVDSAARRYLDDYGTLLLNLGRVALRERRDNKTALQYFEQAATITWRGRAVAFLEIATLLRGNVPLALARAERALALEESLVPEQRRALYRILMDLHRRAGDFERARLFRDRLGAPQGG